MYKWHNHYTNDLQIWKSRKSLMNDSLENNFGYNFRWWPLAMKGIWSSLMVCSFIKPFPYIVSIMYGPIQQVQSFPSKFFNLESYKRAQSLSLNLFFLMKLSCHFSHCCWTTEVWCRETWWFSSNSLLFFKRCFWGSEKSIPTCSVVLNFFTSNSIKSSTCTSTKSVISDHMTKKVSHANFLKLNTTKFE